MSPLAINLTAQGASAAMSLLILPLCAQTLGAEALGVLGLAATLQIFVFLLDGCNAMTRLVAMHHGGPAGAQRAAALVASAERAYLWVLGIGLLLSLGLAWPVAEKIAQRGQLPVTVLGPALALVGTGAFLKLLASQYRGGVVGLHLQVRANLVALGANVLRFPVAFLSTLVLPDLRVFLAIQALSFLVEAALLRHALRRHLPALAQPDIATGRLLWRRETTFLAGTMGLAALGAVATQADKLLLVSRLSLADFGAASLAILLCGGLFVLATPVLQLFLPRLVQSQHVQERRDLLCRLLATLWCLAWPAMALVALGGPALARVVAPSGQVDQALLAQAFLLWGLGNGVALVNTGLYLPFFALGRLRRYATCLMATLALYLPLAWWALEHFGLAGAGAAFLSSQLLLMAALAFALRPLGLATPTLAGLLAGPLGAMLPALWAGGIIASALPTGFLNSMGVVALLYLLSLTVCLLGLWRWVKPSEAPSSNPVQP